VHSSPEAIATIAESSDALLPFWINRSVTLLLSVVAKNIDIDEFMSSDYDADVLAAVPVGVLYSPPYADAFAPQIPDVFEPRLHFSTSAIVGVHVSSKGGGPEREHRRARDLASVAGRTTDRAAIPSG
jgi:hypothetical protein